MPEAAALETAILHELAQGQEEISLQELVRGLRNSGNNSDDVLLRMALWSLISQQKVQLTRSFNLRPGNRNL